MNQELSARKSKKTKRENYIDIISGIIALIFGILATWLVFSITPKDTWTLTKGMFASEETITDYVPKIEEVDNKLKKSILSKPLSFLSKKIDEETAQEVLKGNLKAVANTIRTYSMIFVVIWVISLVIFWLIFYYLSYWIIGKFIWKEPNSEQEI